MGILGGIILVVAIICGAIRMSKQKDLDRLMGSEKRKLGELVPVLQETKDALSDIGDDGAIKEDVTVTGQIQCQNPLMSPIGNVPCIYYKYRISLRTKVRYQQTDANTGRTEWKTREEEDTLDEGSACVNSFTLNDGTGTIIVEPNQYDEYDGLTKSIDRAERNFQNNQMFQGNQLRIGNISLNVGDFFMMDRYDPNTFARVGGYNIPGVPYNGQPGMAQPGMPYGAQPGMAQPGMPYGAQPGMAQPGMPYGAQPGMAQPGMPYGAQPGMAQPGMPYGAQPGMAQPMAQSGSMLASAFSNIMNRGGMPEVIKYVEEIIGLDRRLTVVGTVCDSMGDFRLRKAGKNKLTISTKSAEEIINEKKSSIKTLGIVTLVCAVLGAILLVVGLISG